MNRIHAGYGEAITSGLGALPSGMRRRLVGVDFWTEVNPAWGGLLPDWADAHPYAPGFKTEAACCYPSRTRDKSVTIVLLEPRLSPSAVVHELAHALMFRERLGKYQAKPVTAYAMNNNREAFAEALTTWLFWGYGDEEIAASDTQTLALFERLAA